MGSSRKSVCKQCLQENMCCMKCDRRLIQKKMNQKDEIEIRYRSSYSQAIDSYLKNAILYVVDRDGICKTTNLQWVSSKIERGNKLILRTPENHKIEKYDGSYTEANNCWESVTTNNSFYHLMKLCFDNDIKFKHEKKYRTLFYDLEAFDHQFTGEFISVSRASCEIGMICIWTEGKKISLINGNRKISNDHGSQVIFFPNEEQLCRWFLNFANEQPTILIAHNGSANMFNQYENAGYDLPFIVYRSNWELDIVYKTFMNKQRGCKGKMIQRIDKLYNIIPVDSQILLQDYMTVSKIPISSLSLDSMAKIIKTESKCPITIQQMNDAFTKNEDLSYVLEYCQRDVQILVEFENKTSMVDDKQNMAMSLNLPMSSVFIQTTAKLVEWTVMRLYHDAGYLCNYSPYIVEDTGKYRGALTYCNPDQVVYRNVIQLDFQSQYPSAIISGNLSLETMCNEHIEGGVDLEDEDGNKYYVDISKQGILSKFVEEQMAIRLDIKKKKEQLEQQKKNCNGSQEELNEINNQLKLYSKRDFVAKVLINSTYGVMGCKSSIMYNKAAAASTTYIGRHMLTVLKGMMEKFCDILVAQDTDSVTMTMKDSIKNYDDVNAMISDINNQLAEINPVFKVSAAEVVISMFNVAKKQYLWTAVKENKENYSTTHWVRDMQYDPNNKFHEVKVRGVQFTKMSNNQQDRLYKEVIIPLLEKSGPIDQVALFNSFYDRELQSLKENISNKEYVSQYATNIKDREKNPIAKVLRLRYSALLGSKQIWQVIPMRGYNKRACSYIPLELLDGQNSSQIDVAQCIESYVSEIRKILCGNMDKSQRKIVTKYVTDFQKDYKKKKSQFEPDREVLVRKERVKNGVVNNTLEIIPFDYLAIVLQKNKDTVYHEQFSDDIPIRLFLDIDKLLYPEDLEIAVNHLCSLVKQITGCVIQHNIIKNAKKQAFHVYFNVAVERQFAKYLAITTNQYMTKLRQTSTEYKVIDTAVYRRDGQMRIPECGKLIGGEKENGLIKNAHYNAEYAYNLPKGSDIRDYIVTRTQNLTFIETPLHLLEIFAIDDEYISKTEVSFKSSALEDVQKWCAVNEIPAEVSYQDEKFIRIITHSSFMCPICHKIHDSDNMFAYQKINGIEVKCHRARDNKISDGIIIEGTKLISVNKDELKNYKQAQVIEECKTILKEPVQMLDNARQQNQKHIDIDFANLEKKMIYVRSPMGSGKTHQLIRYHNQLTTENCLIVSHRITFSHELAQRYGQNRQIKSYQDVQGIINFDDFKSCVVQAESLHRVRSARLNVMIIDEVESILSQMNGSLCFQKRTIEHLIRLITQADRVIVLDAFLQQQTMDILNKLCKIRDDQVFVLENIYQPYKDLVTNYHVSDNDNEIIESVIDSVKTGVKHIISCTSYNMAATIKELCSQQGRNYMILHGKDHLYVDDEEELSMREYKANTMKNLQAEVDNHDGLIYTGTISSGIDFRSVGKTIGILKKCTTDSFQFVQGLFRNRTPQDLTLFVHRSPAHQSRYPTHMVSQGYDSVISDLPEQFKAWSSSRIQTMNAYHHRVILQQLKRIGCQIKIGDFKVTKEMGSEIKSIKNEIKRQQEMFTDQITDDIIQAYDDFQQKGWIQQQFQHTYETVKILRSIGMSNQDLKTVHHNYERISQMYNQPVDLAIKAYLQDHSEALRFRRQIFKMTNSTEPSRDMLEKIVQDDRDQRAKTNIASKKIMVVGDKNIDEHLGIMKVHNALLKVGDTFTIKDLGDSLAGVNSRKMSKYIQCASILLGKSVSNKTVKVNKVATKVYTLSNLPVII